jgi:hypothetical protein
MKWHWASTWTMQCDIYPQFKPNHIISSIARYNICIYDVYTLVQYQSVPIEAIVKKGGVARDRSSSDQPR